MLEYFTDGVHLVCKPYSIENLHRMAKSLGLQSHWYHHSSTDLCHYDIPKRRKDDILNVCTIVPMREIVSIIRQATQQEHHAHT